MEHFEICGTSYPTRDGTGIRDYIHVWDVVSAHLSAVKYIEANDISHRVFNIGTGNGTTVKEFIGAFEKALGKTIAKKETKPRPGDVVGGYASCELAKKILNWEVSHTVEQGLELALAWNEKN